MRIKETKVYQFGELSENARQKAIEKLFYINVDYRWWESIYEDAENVGLKIHEFDIGRGSFCKAIFVESAEETAEKIVREHGIHCETAKTAKVYLENRTNLVSKYSDGINTDIVAEDNEYDFDKECNDLDDELLKSICEDYRIILQKEYEYLTSEEAIIETIEANCYEFDEQGNLA
jgi:hypothetical protein